MDFEYFKNTFGKLHGHNLPAYVAVLAGLLLLLLVFKTTKFVARLMFLIIATVLFAAAYWWYGHIRS